LTDDAALAAGGDGWHAPPRWRTWEIAALAALVLLGLFLRSHDYTLAPVPSDNRDELGWAWSGLTLLTRHVPYSWSYLSAYPGVSALTLKGATYPIVHPWLDHPPLFSVLMGAEAWLLGARDLRDVTPEMIRPVVITLSSLSIALLYALGRRVLPWQAALVAAALLATAPIAVLFGRAVESENLLAPLLLIALLLTHRLLTGESRRAAMAGLALLCVAASLTKVPGVTVGIACGVMLLVGGRWRLAVLAVGAGLLGLLLYAGYGALLDWNTFTAVLSAQEARRHGVMGAYEFIVSPAGVGTSARDGWWMLGWIGMGALLVARGRAARLLPWAALVFVAAILLFADERLVVRFGWYRIAVYPLVYAAAAYVGWEAVKEAALIPLVALLVLGGAAAASFGLTMGTEAWMPSPLIVSAVLAVVLLPALVAAVRKESTGARRVAQAVGATALLVMLGLNVLESLRLDQIYKLL
jgi:Dolichyl-phosphate-mannose-protein mannosyltransferase